MKKIIAIAVAGMFAAGAYAQKPPSQLMPENGVESTGVPSGKAVAAGEAARQARLAAHPGENAPSQLMQENGVESTGVTTGRAAAAGEARKQARKAAHPGEKAPSQLMPENGVESTGVPSASK